MNILVFIQRRSLLFYYSNRNQPVQCIVPETVMNDLEILNEQELHELFKRYIPPKDPKVQTQVILLLSDDVCFSSWLEAGKEEQVKKTTVENAPFARIESVTIPFDQHMLYIITNQDLYGIIGHELETYNCSIIGIYPWVIAKYGKLLNDGGVFDSTVVKKIFEAHSHLKAYSFSYLSSQTPSIIDTQNKTEQAKKSIPTGWIIFILFTFLYIVAMFFIFIRK